MPRRRAIENLGAKRPCGALQLGSGRDAILVICPKADRPKEVANCDRMPRCAAGPTASGVGSAASAAKLAAPRGPRRRASAVGHPHR